MGADGFTFNFCQNPSQQNISKVSEKEFQMKRLENIDGNQFRLDENRKTNIWNYPDDEVNFYQCQAVIAGKKILEKRNGQVYADERMHKPEVMPTRYLFRQSHAYEINRERIVL